MSYTHIDCKSICVAVIPTSLSVFKNTSLAVITETQGVWSNITAFYCCGWMSLSRVKPHQWSRSISAHWLSKHLSLCRKDSVRLMGGRQAGRQIEGLSGISLFLLGEAFHQLQLLHWFPLLIDGDELQRSTGIKNEASPNWFKSVTPT